MSTNPDDIEQPLIKAGYDEKQVDQEKLEKSYFEVMGLCCSSEVPLIEGILKPLDGVKEISVVVPSRTVIVVHDSLTISTSQLVQALNQVRLQATIRPKGEESYAKKWPGVWDMACGVLLALSFLKYVYQPMQWLAIGAVLIGVPNIIWRSVASIKNLTLNVNVIVLLSVAGTISLQDYTDAGIIVFLYNIAQWLESRATHKAVSVMSSLTSMTPLKATLAESGQQVDVTSVQLGTIIAVKAGEVVPIDGVVVEGKCEVDEKALTGESLPVTKDVSSIVWAGTINLNGYVSVQTTMLAENSLVARMVNLVEEAQSRKANIQTFIDDCAKWYIPVVVLISAGVAVIPILLHTGDRLRWFHLALVVLVSACPCALVISTPVTIFCALSKAATTGLLFKGGDYLELLAKVKTIAFDKTGTITRGEFVATHFQTLTETFTREKLLFWISSIESKSSHPMAAALIDYAVMNSIKPLPEKVEEFQNYPGEGIYGKIEGEHVYVGNHRISLRAGYRGNFEDIDSNKLEGKASGFIYIGATLVGIFSLSDECRIGAMEAINELKGLGIKTVMLTGDNHGAAQLVQNQLKQAIDIVHAELLPEDKAKLVKELKNDGVVGMVGDGINDALALASADIGISMGISGSALAMETGNVILMSNDMKKIPQAIQISKRSSRKIIENVIISFSTKGVVLALAIAGYSMLLTAVLTDVGTCLLVIFNSMLLLRETHESKSNAVSTVPSSTQTCVKTCCEKAKSCGTSVRKEVEPHGTKEECCATEEGSMEKCPEISSATSKVDAGCCKIVPKCCGKTKEVLKADESSKGCWADKSSEMEKTKQGCCATSEDSKDKMSSTTDIRAGCCRKVSNCCARKNLSFRGQNQIGRSNSLDIVIA